MKQNDIIMHVNYCEQGQSLSAICHNAVKWGYDGVEFRRKRNGVNETLADYLGNLDKAISEAGLQKIYFGSPGPNLMQEDASARQQEVESYIDFLGKAKARFGATFFNTFSGPLRNPDPSVPYTACDKQGSGTAGKEHYEWAAEGFREIARFAEAEKLTLAFETHSSYLHDLPAPTKKLVDAIGSPAVGINFDFCNMQVFPQPIGLNEAVETLGDSIYYLHLKNLYRLPPGGYIMTSLAEGQINNRDLLRLVFEKGYDGPIGIEAPRQGDREWFAREDLAYLKSVLEDL